MYGGSALFFANMLDLLKKGKVITIDINKRDDYPKHPRITYIHGSSIDEKIFTCIKEIIKKEKRKKVMVVLDSNHHKNHVLKELELYSGLVTKDSYLIVEDTNSEYKEGNGYMAIKEFLKTNNSFKIDKTKEKFYLTLNENGYLKKIK